MLNVTPFNVPPANGLVGELLTERILALESLGSTCLLFTPSTDSESLPALPRQPGCGNNLLSALLRTMSASEHRQLLCGQPHAGWMYQLELYCIHCNAPAPSAVGAAPVQRHLSNKTNITSCVSTPRQKLHKMCLWARTQSHHAVIPSGVVHVHAYRAHMCRHVIVALAKVVTVAAARRLTFWKCEVDRSWLCIEQHPDLAVVWVRHPVTGPLLLTADKLHDYQAGNLHTPQMQNHP